MFMCLLVYFMKTVHSFGFCVITWESFFCLASNFQHWYILPRSFESLFECSVCYFLNSVIFVSETSIFYDWLILWTGWYPVSMGLWVQIYQFLSIVNELVIIGFWTLPGECSLWSASDFVVVGFVQRKVYFDFGVSFHLLILLNKMVFNQ